MGWVIETATAATIGRIVVVALLIVSGVVLARNTPAKSWYDQLGERLFLGVPWGTLLAACGLLSMYLFVQGGIASWHDPVTVPYVARTYFDPHGMVAGPFAHQDAGHLIGNLTALFVVGPVAEYIYGHYDGERFGPVGRAASFVFGLFVVGLLTGLFSWTSLIGFSGVTFALAGFVLVRYPIVSVLIVVFRELVSEIIHALEDPILTSNEMGTAAQWFDVAIQGHAFGFLVGVLCGIILLRHRNEQPPSFGRLWLGALLVTTSKALWAWWVPGIDGSVVYPGLGIGLVLTSALIIAYAVRVDDRRFLGRLTRSEVATVLLVGVLVFVTVLAVPVHLTTVEAGNTDNAVQVGEYAISYQEGPAVRTTQAGDLPNAFRSGSPVQGGVVVVNDEREFWTLDTNEDELEATGETTVRLGGLGWDKTIGIERKGWETDSGVVYTVRFDTADEPPEQVFASDPADVDTVVDGREISIESNGESFVLVIEGEGTERVSIPEEGNAVSAGGITIYHEDGRLIAGDDDSRTVIATEEEYD